MSRADDLRARLQAEVAVVELEEELLRLKGLKRPDPEKVQQAKLALRDARRRFRSFRAGAPVEAEEGDAVVRPATVEAAAGIKQPGGGE